MDACVAFSEAICHEDYTAIIPLVLLSTTTPDKKLFSSA
jgi:hypothetical protein